MEDSYISNIQEDDQILDSDSIEKIHQLETQIESLKLQLSESEKKIISQKHQIENMEIELSNKNNTIKNLEGLVQFYQQEKGSNDEDNKYQEYENKIKNLEESLEIKNKKIEEIKKDLTEQNAVNEKLINALVEKEENNKNKRDEDDLSDDSDDNLKANDVRKLSMLQDKVEELEENINELNKEKEDIK